MVKYKIDQAIFDYFILGDGGGGEYLLNIMLEGGIKFWGWGWKIGSLLTL